MYGIAQWYIAKHKNEPLQYGVTFIPRYVRYYDLDPMEAMKAMVEDLGVRRFRLVSYWDDIETTEGQFNFEELDWQFAMAEAYGVSISLAIGLRQPRWPECHMPVWAEQLPKEVWSQKLKVFMEQVIKRYKQSPALKSYQLENEFFMTVFGICPDHSRERLVDEYNFVKSLDSEHPIVVSRSNNWIGIPINEPQPDQFGISVYKRVWDKAVTKRYFEYPLPAWFYAFLAGTGEIVTGKDMIIHELQAEPWAPNDLGVRQISVEEQNKSLNAERLKDRFGYARATGMRTIDLWGAEMWYWRKVALGDSSLWDTAKEELARGRQLRAQ